MNVSLSVLFKKGIRDTYFILKNDEIFREMSHEFPHFLHLLLPFYKTTSAISLSLSSLFKTKNLLTYPEVQNILLHLIFLTIKTNYY